MAGLTADLPPTAVRSAHKLTRLIRRDLDGEGFAALDWEADSALIALSATLDALEEKGRYHGFAEDALTRAGEALPGIPSHWQAEARRLAPDAAENTSDMSLADLIAAPLWPADNPIGAEWSRARAILADMPGGAFFIDWYQRALDGRPQNGPLLRDVALIGDGLWREGGDRLDAEIRRLAARHASPTSRITPTTPSPWGNSTPAHLPNGRGRGRTILSTVSSPPGW